jgi:hypothetical protein
MSDFFNEAYRRAHRRYTADQWLALTPRQVTEAIYQAMREIDAATVAAVAILPAAKAEKAPQDAKIG